MSNVSRVMCGLLALGMLNMAQAYQDQPQGRTVTPPPASTASQAPVVQTWGALQGTTAPTDPVQSHPVVDFPIPQTPVFAMGFGTVLRKTEGKDGVHELVIKDQESGRDLKVLVHEERTMVSENREPRTWADITTGSVVDVTYQMKAPDGADVFGVPEEELQYLAMFIGLGDNAPQGNE